MKHEIEISNAEIDAVLLLNPEMLRIIATERDSHLGIAYANIIAAALHISTGDPHGKQN